MYKSRIRTWGLDKKLKENEARAIIHFLVHHRGKASNIQLRGRRVDIKAVESHFKRKGMAIADILGTDAPHVSSLVCETPDMSENGVPRCLPNPEPFKTTELLCADVREYVLSSFGTGRWLPHMPDQYCNLEKFKRTQLEFASLLIQHSLEILYVTGRQVMDQLDMATMEEARKVSVKFMKSIEGQISDNFLIVIQFIAALVVWPPWSIARTLSKNLCFIISTHDFKESHVNMYLRKVFTRTGQLASSDEIPDYLLAVTRSSVDSYEHVLGQYHPQTLSVTVTLSRIMCILYGPDGLSEPLEALLSSLESQHGPGTRQSILLRDEIGTYRLGVRGFDIWLPVWV